MEKKERINAAIERAFEEFGFESFFDAHCAPNYVEVTGETGGDVRKLRFYNDGHVGA